ncbi:dipeptidyl aminopeptidase/acylaminoacyl peptidase [Pedobacter cryoconitis]|uniref:S9 family peptidase n=1 Tax=Pedobacter cryoconitis TaxID=188932 RepID=UPI00161FF1F9|nr:S9 family peptidase [Pedobacter cryoconitis]MBB6272319.1 dipeptidyl aminopeptidase/acylaminoacyl peptidase [Pedobacter cryoconitis]
MKQFIQSGLFIMLISIQSIQGQTKSSTLIKLPGDTTLPSTEVQLRKIASNEKGNFSYRVEDYFSKPQVSEFQLSPDGKFISFRQKDEYGQRDLYVKNIKTGSTIKVLTEHKELIRQYSWINNNRIIYLQDKGGDENYQLFAINRDGTGSKALTPFPKVRVSILQQLKNDTNSLIIEMNLNNPEIFEPYHLNTLTGKIKNLFKNTDKKNPASSFDFDRNGILRAYNIRYNGTQNKLMYKALNDKTFRPVNTSSWKDQFLILDFDYTDPSGNNVYVLSNIDRDKSTIFLYDMKHSKVIKTLFENKSFDAGGLAFSTQRKNTIDYYTFTGERNEMVPASDYFKNLYQKFNQKFRHKAIAIVSVTDNEDKYLLAVSSDRLYQTYELYDAVKDEFTLIKDVMPQLKENDMATMHPIHFQTRDGLVIYGYLTLPNSASRENPVPLIVNPHGGPYGERDNWRFNPETQLFASRGYATLQINYRGSGGYGKAYLLKGSKQIGREMLNDLEDGIAFALQQGLINKDKIAIYGGSYGGLATLGSLVKTPALYKCAVDYVGVSNLFTFINSFPPYWKPLLKQFYEQWYNPENPQEHQIMTAVSPALNADQIKTPLLVVQGANDPRVNINESDQMVKKLRSRGFETPYLVRYNEGHGFYHEENRIALYQTMLGFFAKYLK